MKGKWPLVLLGALVVLSLATMPGCSLFGPTHLDSFGHVIGNLLCQDPHVTVLRGQSNCKINSDGNLECELMNPCEVSPGLGIDGQWADLLIGSDDFLTGDCNNVPFLPGSVNGITVNTKTGVPTTTGFPTKRFLVADSTTQPEVDFPVCYTYNSRPNPTSPSGVGFGSLYVTTAVSGSSSFRLTVVDMTGIRNFFVFSSPSGISCFNGANCSTLFPARTYVTLTAEANSVFWSGCDTFTRSTCTVVMDADRAVTVSQ
jgi:hypothetical protein